MMNKELQWSLPKQQILHQYYRNLFHELHRSSNNCH